MDVSHPALRGASGWASFQMGESPGHLRIGMKTWDKKCAQLQPGWSLCVPAPLLPAELPPPTPIQGITLCSHPAVLTAGRRTVYTVYVFIWCSSPRQTTSCTSRNQVCLLHCVPKCGMVGAQ